MVATADSLGMAKDAMAAKPMVLYESDEFIALASEEVAIRSIFPHEIDTFDPYEGRSAYGRANARRTAAQELLSHEMGMHTEQLGGRTQQASSIAPSEDDHASSIPAPSTSTTTSAPNSTPPTGAERDQSASSAS